MSPCTWFPCCITLSIRPISPPRRSTSVPGCGASEGLLKSHLSETPSGSVLMHWSVGGVPPAQKLVWLLVQLKVVPDQEPYVTNHWNIPATVSVRAKKNAGSVGNLFGLGSIAGISS